MDRNSTGARAKNPTLRVALNTPGEHKVKRFGLAFGVGDKAMQIESNCKREVYDGNIGFVVDIGRKAASW